MANIKFNVAGCIRSHFRSCIVIDFILVLYFQEIEGVWTRPTISVCNIDQLTGNAYGASCSHGLFELFDSILGSESVVKRSEMGMLKRGLLTFLEVCYLSI